MMRVRQTQREGEERQKHKQVLFKKHLQQRGERIFTPDTKRKNTFFLEIKLAAFDVPFDLSENAACVQCEIS